MLTHRWHDVHFACRCSRLTAPAGATGWRRSYGLFTRATVANEFCTACAFTSGSDAAATASTEGGLLTLTARGKFESGGLKFGYV